jgi:hypothetical protein
MADESAANSAPTARPIGKPFQKGRSGNPSGRPALFPAFREECRAHSPAALARLVAALEKDDASSIKAAELILAYGWGKPTAIVDLQADLNISITRVLEEARQRAMITAKGDVGDDSQ